TADELVLISGCPPIRAKKARYFEEKRFRERVLPPPETGRVPEQGYPDEWYLLPLGGPSAALVAWIEKSGGEATSGLRRKPELTQHVAVAKETPTPQPRREFDVADETDDNTALQARALSQQMRGLARQAALDPDDGLGL